MKNLQVIKHGTGRVLTTQQLSDSYGASERKITDNFNNNKTRYIEEKHYHLLQGDELKEFKDDNENFGFVGKNASQLYLWTEKGALLHAKSLNTDKAWEVYEHLVETYFKVQELKQPVEQLSPMLQVLINMEMEQKQIKEQLNQVTNNIEENKQEVQAIRDVVAINSTNWRKDTANLISKMALKLGGYEHINILRDESYKTLEQRVAVQLNTRLTNKRRRMADEGVCKSKRDKLNKLDVIADDKKILETYLAVVKDMAIKYGA